MNIIQQIRENRERYYDQLYSEYVKANDLDIKADYEEKSSERAAQSTQQQASRQNVVREASVSKSFWDVVNGFFNTEETREFELEADRRIVG